MIMKTSLPTFLALAGLVALATQTCADEDTDTPTSSYGPAPLGSSYVPTPLEISDGPTQSVTMTSDEPTPLLHIFLNINYRHLSQPAPLHTHNEFHGDRWSGRVLR